MPPLPPWDGLHPLVVHFPIALLLVAPVLVAIAAFVRGQIPWLGAALVVMAMGTAGAWLAVETGEAAGQLLEHRPELSAVLERHEDMAESASAMFTALTLVLAGLLAARSFIKRPLSRLWRMAPLGVYLAVYAGAALSLANTAHEGGRLVHELGIHAAMGPRLGGSPAQATEPEDEDDDD